MAANKTVPTKQSVNSFIESIEDASRQTDAKNLTKFLTKVTGKKALLWSIASNARAGIVTLDPLTHAPDLLSLVYTRINRSSTRHFLS